MSDKTHVNVNFFEPQDVDERDWGKEILLGLLPGVASMKMLVLKAGKKGGLQKHHLKNEIGYLHSGKMIVRFDTGNGKIQERIILPGECIHFPPGAVHQEEAVEDCVIFELSTPHFNDRVRMEETYGMEISEGGLPSTTIDEVETR